MGVKTRPETVKTIHKLKLSGNDSNQKVKVIIIDVVVSIRSSLTIRKRLVTIAAMRRMLWAPWTVRLRCSKASSRRSRSTWSCADTVRTLSTWTWERSARRRRVIQWTSLAIGSRSFRWPNIVWKGASGTQRACWTWASRTVSTEDIERSIWY